jgi:hypothetical protein
MLARMNPNRRRGEVGAVLDGAPRVLCLTLGALAELETAFGAEDLGALVKRFGGGRMTAGDIVRIVGAGLRGGGNVFSDDEVAAMTIEGGARGFAGLVGRLLTATFGDAEEASAAEGRNPL